MSFKTTASHHNRAVIETEIGIPRNTVIKNNSVIQGNVCSKSAVKNKQNHKNKKFCFGGRENEFQETKEFIFDFQKLKISAKIGKRWKMSVR